MIPFFSILLSSALLVANPCFGVGKTPYDFGATSDPTTHQAAIQAALDAGGVVIPAGTTWVVNESLRVGNNTSITGYGASSVIQTDFRETMKGLILLKDNSVNVSISGIHFQGPNTPNPQFDFGRVVYGRRIKNFSFSENRVSGFPGGAVYLVASIGSLISNNIISGARGLNANSADIALASGSQNYLISNNLITTDLNTSISVGANAMDLLGVISGNVIDVLEPPLSSDRKFKKRHGITASYGSGSATGKVSILGNVINNTNWSGIYAVGFGTELIITGNIIEKTGSELTVGGFRGGIVVLDSNSTGPRRVSITNNTITDVIELQSPVVAGIAVTLSNPQSQAAILGNTISRAHRGISVSLANNFQISNNTIIDCKIGIYGQGNQLGLLQGDISFNTITQTDQTHGLATGAISLGIRVDKGGDDPHLRIFGNRLHTELENSIGISLRFAHYQIRDNFLKGYSEAVWLQEVITSRLVNEFSIQQNTIVDSTIGYSVSGNSAGLVVMEGTHLKNVQFPFVNRSGNVQVAFEGRTNGEFIELYLESPPINLSFIRGDRVLNYKVSKQSPSYWVYDGGQWLAGPPL